MAVNPLSSGPRRVLATIGLGVALPALLLAGLAIFLTYRIAQSVEEDSARYNGYIALQVGEAFEQELLDHVRRGIGPAENAARGRASAAEIEALLEQERGEFGHGHYVSVDALDGYSLLMVASQPLIYAVREGSPNEYFVGWLLRGPDGQVSGAGGWWIDTPRFLATHLDAVVRERMPQNPRLYGGFESTRRLAVALRDTEGRELARVREPATLRTAQRAPLSGPFESFSVQVASTSNAAAVWTRRFVAIEMTFIGLMGMVIVLATFFGLRFMLRQLELAQIKAAFVSNVTHELKTPIALIRLAVETLEMRRINNPQDTEKFLGTISRETLRLQSLVDNVLDFSRLEAGRHVFKFENVDLADVVRETVDGFRPRLEQQGFRIEEDVPERLPLVRADATAVSHCVLNLLDNAIKYSRERREVRVEAGVRGGDVYVAVRDRGIGIPAADQPKVFEKFVRLETGLVHDVKGAGLGLSLVDQIIRAHGGRVELASQPDEGSTFTLVLPVAKDVEAAPEEARRKTGS